MKYEIEDLNKASPSKFEWAIAVFLFIILFLSFSFGDTVVLIRNQIDFADAFLHGEFLNSYKLVHDKAMYAAEHGLDATFGWSTVYDAPVNIILGIWGIPLYLYLKYTGTNYTADFFQVAYGKSLFLLAFIISVVFVYKTLRTMKVDEARAKWGAFLYFSSTMAFNCIGIMGQVDSMGVALTLLCVLNHVKGNNKWAFIWFLAAFPFKHLVTFIYLPLLLMRDKNLFRNTLKLIAAGVFKIFYDLLAASSPALNADKNKFFIEHIMWLLKNRIPFLGSEISIFVLLFGILCVYCYIKKESDDFDERNRDIILVAMTAMAIELNTGAGNLDWFLYLAPFMAITVVLYGKEIKNLILFETMAGITWMFYNYTHFHIYGSKQAAKMLLGKIFAFPELKSIDTLLQQNSADTTTVLMNAIRHNAGGLAKYIYGAEVMFGTLFIVCILALIYLSRRENTGEININIRPYALSRLFVNAFIMYMPLYLFIYRALAY